MPLPHPTLHFPDTLPLVSGLTGKTHPAFRFRGTHFRSDTVSNVERRVLAAIPRYLRGFSIFLAASSVDFSRFLAASSVICRAFSRFSRRASSSCRDSPRDNATCVDGAFGGKPRILRRSGDQVSKTIALAVVALSFSRPESASGARQSRRVRGILRSPLYRVNPMAISNLSLAELPSPLSSRIVQPSSSHLVRRLPGSVVGLRVARNISTIGGSLMVSFGSPLRAPCFGG